MKTNIEILADVCRYENVSEIELNDDITVEEALEAMREYGKYCAAEGWNAALKEVDALMRKPCWDLTLCEDIKKLKK